MTHLKLSDLTLEELFPDSLANTVCVNLSKDREIWVAMMMCSEYLESMIDTIIVRDEEFKPIGMIGGYELVHHLRKNPTRETHYHTKVADIMSKDIVEIEEKTKFKELIEIWKRTHRAFAVINNEYGDCSSVSARKMVQVGTKCKPEFFVSSLPKKKIITFQKDDTLGKILDLMVENKTRRLVLENSTQFISDRVILEEISKILRFQTDIENFRDIPVSTFNLENMTTVTEDITFNRLCQIMERLEYPYVLYKDTVFTPWDVCIALSKEDLVIPLKGYREKRTCPHCGKEID